MEKITPKRNPTPRQRRAAKAVIENALLDKPKSSAAVLESVGYGTGLQNQPNRVLQGEGFKKALAEFGLTEELITTALVEDIKAKPAQRVKELGLGADILGMRKHEEEPQQKSGGNTYNFIFSKDVQDRVKVIEAEIKQILIKPNVQDITES